MGALNLLGEEGMQEVKKYDIHLTEKFEKNIEKSDRLREVTEKWVQVLRKALSYPRSTRASTDVRPPPRRNSPRKCASGSCCPASSTSWSTNST